MRTLKPKVKVATDFDLMYIELTDVQKNLDASSKNAQDEGKKMTKIFTELRHILKIKHDTR